MRTMSDSCCLYLDQVLRTLFGKPHITSRQYPAQAPESTLNEAERKQVTGLMRVNHTGEVCAQALYLGQALTARNADMKAHMQCSAAEENDHLDWCEKRLSELHDRKSFLNPLWYAGSFAIGLLAGFISDKASLSFLAETEHQVTAHLQDHLTKLPAHDKRSKEIIEQMIIDESQHATTAIFQGGTPLPRPIQTLMRASSKIMTKTAYLF